MFGFELRPVQSPPQGVELHVLEPGTPCSCAMCKRFAAKLICAAVNMRRIKRQYETGATDLDSASGEAVRRFFQQSAVLKRN